MSTYTNIQGQTVVYRTSDPSPLIEGQIWYNGTTNVFKITSGGVARTLTTTAA